MALLFSAELNALFHDFYRMTGGINISIFESPVFFSQYEMTMNFGNVIAYPSIDMGDVFCKAIRKSQKIDEKCLACDKMYNDICMESGKVTIYRCHLGFWEAQIPVPVKNSEHNAVIFIGQIDDKPASAENFMKIWNILRKVDPETFQPEKQKQYYAYYMNNLHRITFQQFEAYCSFLRSISASWNQEGLVTLKNENSIDSIRNYIRSHLTEVIRAETLCEVLHISRATLYRQIKKYSGLGFNSFVNQSKMDCACQLLKQRYLVKEVATMIGYDNVSYFSRLFKQSIGVSPVKYRDMHTNYLLFRNDSTSETNGNAQKTPSEEKNGNE